ncbi:MAG: dTDP-4-dehydrorhamnose reductase [Pseudomonadales bacterium]|nr:dTDP-4-dehydrorhamnose reductase [Pseudomonadales bacterium]MAR90858.1 dTDP-4-dehydrorhamnose reductase [Pseudomonadales bacterium]
MKIVITGADGQLGQTLTHCLADCDVTPLSRSALDITSDDLNSQLQAHRPDWVVNTAAYTAVDKAESEASLADHANHIAVGMLAAACKELGSRLLHLSTDFVFSGSGNIPYAVDAECDPENIYGKTKHQGEQAALAAHPAGVCIVRTAWLYSASGNNFVRTMLRLMQERDSLGIVMDQIGSPTSTSTLATCIRELIKQSETGIFHWTDAGTASWYDFAVAIYEEAQAAGILSRPVSITPIRSEQFPTPAARPHYSVLDISKTYSHTGLQPIHWRVPLRTVIGKIAEMENNIV